MGHGELSDMEHGLFLKSTGDIGDPPSRAPSVYEFILAVVCTMATDDTIWSNAKFDVIIAIISPSFITPASDVLDTRTWLEHLTAEWFWLEI